MDKKKKSLIIGARLLIIIGILGAVLLWGIWKMNLDTFILMI